MKVIKGFNAKVVLLCLLSVLAVMAVGVACSDSGSNSNNQDTNASSNSNDQDRNTEPDTSFTAAEVELSDIRVAVTAFVNSTLNGATPPPDHDENINTALTNFLTIFTMSRAEIDGVTDAEWSLLSPSWPLPFATLTSADYTVTINGEAVDNATLTDLVTTDEYARSNALAYYDALIRETTAAINQ